MRSEKLFQAAVVAAVCGLTLGIPTADADTLTGVYESSDTGHVNITSPEYSNGSPNVLTTYKFNWNRSDLPAGPGVDNTIPDLFVGYCIELDQTVGANTSTTYEVQTPAAAGLNANQILLLSRLYGTFHDNLPGADDVAAFQCMVYEIIYDGNNVNLSAGNFLMQNAAINAIVKPKAEVMALVISSPMYNGPTSPLAVLHSDSKQDQLVRIIPTPATATLGLLGAGMLIRRRRA